MAMGQKQCDDKTGMTMAASIRQRSSRAYTTLPRKQSIYVTVMGGGEERVGQFGGEGTLSITLHAQKWKVWVEGATRDKRMADWGWWDNLDTFLPSSRETTSLSMALPTALQNTNRIATIICLSLFPATSMTLSRTALFLLWPLLIQAQPFITHSPVVSWLFHSSLQGCHHCCNETLLCRCHLQLTPASLLPPSSPPLWAAPQATTINPAAIPRFEPIIWPKQDRGGKSHHFPEPKASGTTHILIKDEINKT